MKIRTQNLLFIVPIFLGIAIINGLLSYNRQLAEVKWGMEEEIKALATAASEFIDGDACRKLINGELDSERLESFRLPLKRIIKIDSGKQTMNQKELEENKIWVWIWEKLPGFLRNQAQGYNTWEKLRRLFILAPDGQQVIFTLGKDVENKNVYPTLPDIIEAIKNNKLRLLYRTPDDKMVVLQQDEVASVSDLIRAIKSNNVVFTDVHQPTIYSILSDSYNTVNVPAQLSDAAIMAGYAPIYDESDTLSGIFGVEIDAETIGMQKSLIGMKIIIISAGIFLLGTLVALFISGIITRKIRELNEGAKVVAEGDYNRRVDIETIQEVIDLGNTFNTMSSVLEEILSRTKRELIESRQFRTQADLAKTYNETFFEPQEMTFGDIEIAARLISTRPTGDFFGAFQVAGSVYAVLGRVRSEEELDFVTTASAAFSLIRQELSKFEPEQVFKDACELFDIETLECIYWDEAENKLQWLGHNPNGGSPLQRTMPLQEQKTLVFHTIREPTGEKIDSYVRLFGYLLPVELMEDLMVILDEGSEGSLITIGKR